MLSLSLLAILLWIAEERTPAAPAQIVGAPLVYVRKGPGVGFEPAGVLAAGTSVNTVESAGSWTKVETADGKDGFVHNSYLSSSPAVAAEPTPSAAAPASAEPAATPGAEASEPGPTRDQLAVEIAGLRSEITDLKGKIEGRVDPVEERPPLTQLSERNPPGDPNVRLIAVGITSLLVGWLFGALFSRKRGRAQRNRLRF